MPDRAVAAHPYNAHIAEASQRFGIPTAWIRAVMSAESAGDARALSSAGAMGLMQVMPHTWAELRRRYGLGHDPFEPRDNIHAGAAYLREMWTRYGNVAAMLAAYNAGPARYDEYRAAGRPLPAETRAYVAALAPVLHGEVHSASASTAARSRDWREAAIFVARDQGASAGVPALPDALPNDAPPSVPEASAPLAPARPGGLFVARNDTDGHP